MIYRLSHRVSAKFVQHFATYLIQYSFASFKVIHTIFRYQRVSIVVDLAPLNGSAPTAVQYAWGVADCCDHSDADLYIKHGCGLCPIMSSSNLPANPFKAKVSSKPVP